MYKKFITLKELKITLGLSLVFNLRMFGMFMVLPVLSTYGQQLKDANKFLLGLAFGIYGITQAIFQIILGFISDKLGRKRIILIGLIIFLIGSVIPTLINSIWGVILGRALQGIGAISSVIIALLSDMINEQNKTKVFALLGISIGITFGIAIIFSPIITHNFGLKGLFGITSILTLFSILIVLFLIPNDNLFKIYSKTTIIKNDIKKIIFNHQLFKLNISIFCLHAILIMNFIILPILLNNVGFSNHQHWKIYLWPLIISFNIVFPVIFYSEKYHCINKIFSTCIIILLISQILYYFFYKEIWIIIISLHLFFITFNIMEALLPLLVTQNAPINYKGTTMGIYLTSQFLGMALGGIIGGWIFHLYEISFILITSISICIIWFLISLMNK